MKMRAVYEIREDLITLIRVGHYVGIINEDGTLVACFNEHYMDDPIECERARQIISAEYEG